MRAFRVGSQVLASLSILAILGCVTARASAQSKDRMSASLAGSKRQFLAFVPRGRTVASTLGHATEPDDPSQIDSISTFSGEFQTAGVGPKGDPRLQWFYAIAGGAPAAGGTTQFDAPIVPVSLDLLDWNKSVRVVNGHKLHYSVKPFIEPVLNSPVFQDAEYSSSDVPTQFADAVQRAEFYNAMQQDWHTRLRPSIKAERTIAVPRGAYRFALEKDGTCCAFVLIDLDVFSKLLFPANAADIHTPVGAAEHAGDVTTQSVATFLFPNTYLYANGDPTSCCILGFHTYDFEPGDIRNGFREKRYVMTFASWISPGLFGPEFQDVTAVSHEITEALNDPFVASDDTHGLTPWWYSLNGHCQNDLEVGDAVEGMPGAAYPMKMNGRVYHPQNEALLPWFEFQSPSTAIGGAYSYPNQTLLTALSPPQAMNCQ